MGYATLPSIALLVALAARAPIILAKPRTAHETVLAITALRQLALASVRILIHTIRTAVLSLAVRAVLVLSTVLAQVFAVVLRVWVVACDAFITE